MLCGKKQVKWFRQESQKKKGIKRSVNWEVILNPRKLWRNPGQKTFWEKIKVQKEIPYRRNLTDCQENVSFPYNCCQSSPHVLKEIFVSYVFFPTLQLTAANPDQNPAQVAGLHIYCIGLQIPLLRKTINKYTRVHKYILIYWTRLYKYILLRIIQKKLFPILHPLL